MHFYLRPFKDRPVEVLLAVVKALGDRPRVSAYTLQNALLGFYTEAKLYPSGVFSEIPAVQDWALKQAIGIKKLVTCLDFIGSKSTFIATILKLEEFPHLIYLWLFKSPNPRFRDCVG